MPIIKSKLLTKQHVQDFASGLLLSKYLHDGDNLYVFRNQHSCVWKLRTQYRTGSKTHYSWKNIGDIRDISVPQARKKADELRSLIRQNINVQTHKKYQTNLGKTFGNIREIYLRECKQRIKPQSKEKLTEVLNKASDLNNTPIAKITENEINEIITRVKHTAPSTAATLLCELKAIFTFAYDEKYIVQKLDINIKTRYKVKERTRYLNENKLGILFKNLFKDYDVPNVMKVAIYAIFITILRREELLNIEWSDVDLNSQRITIRNGKRIDNFIISIPTQLSIKLSELQLKNPNTKYVFNSRRYRYSGDVLYKYCKNLGIKYGIGEFTPHDARRTAMTLLADRGYDPTVIDMALGHTQNNIRKHYLKTHLSEPRAKLLQDWANLIDKLMM